MNNSICAIDATSTDRPVLRMQMRLRAGFLGVGVALAALVTPGPSATAAPNCDPTTSDGYLACFGGGPWQNQDGSSPDTYGSLGPRGYLAENRKMGVGGSDAVQLLLGNHICDWRAHGLSETFIEAKLVEDGNSRSTAQILQVNAGFLCSPNGTPRY
jgi:hypothetical protein